jgi:hypothetical protein
VRPTAAAIDAFGAHFADLFKRLAARQACREYLIGLLLPWERNKALTALAALVPGAERQRLHHFLHDAPWDAAALNRRRLVLWRGHPTLAPHAGGVLLVDETGDRKRGRGIVLAAQHSIGKLGHTANGVVAVTSHWADGTRRVPLGVQPSWPASQLPGGKADPTFRSKPELAGELIREAQDAGVPFRVVVADCVDGENAKLEGRLFAARIPSIVALRPNRGTWQFVEDEANPPPFPPAEAARRVPERAWPKLIRRDRHGKELIRDVAELELGFADGPTRPVRLVAATADPTKLKPDATWSMATTLPAAAASPAAVDALDARRDWIEHYDKPVQHDLGWADYQTRAAEAIVRHWQLVMLTFTFSLLAAASPAVSVPPATSPGQPAGGKTTPADRLERDAPTGAPLALPVGAPQHLLAGLEHRAAPARVGRPPGARRPLPAS